MLFKILKENHCRYEQIIVTFEVEFRRAVSGSYVSVLNTNKNESNRSRVNLIVIRDCVRSARGSSAFQCQNNSYD